MNLRGIGQRSRTIRGNQGGKSWMDIKRLTGPQAGSQKYDLLTAMAVAGLSGTPGFQNSMMRLIAVVTARYNWRIDELTVGQKELARMWSVDERTVKREVKRLTDCNILLQLRPGVRGRVAAYRLNYPEIYKLSEPVWRNVGPDFSARMEAMTPKPVEKVVRVDFGLRGTELPDTPPNDPWGKACARLAQTEPSLYRGWLSKLRFVDLTDRVLLLNAPSRFVAQYVETHLSQPLRGAAELEFGPLRRIVIQS
ncbi:MAG: hypothetical protein ACJASV_001802 [Pseudorhodobacter sp.]|jgi:hypothetical protein